jgi:hypothetical protein
MRHLNKKIWPYQITLRTDTSHSAWLVEHIGKCNEDWYCYFDNNSKNTIFAFREEASLLAFKITRGHYEN